MINIFQKFKVFWGFFWNSMRTAYDRTFKEPLETAVQKWHDINKINFLDIFVP